MVRTHRYQRDLYSTFLSANLILGKICGKTLPLQGPLLDLVLSYRMWLSCEPNVVGSLVISDLSIFSSHGFPLLLSVRQARPHPEDEDADEDDQRQHPCHKDELKQIKGAAPF